MKTTTILIANGPTPIKMVDADYSVTLKLGYAETTILVGALAAYRATYAKLMADNPTVLASDPEVSKTIASIIESIERATKAFDVQKLIEAGDLKVGTAYLQP
jgi:hypothetical protein